MFSLNNDYDFLKKKVIEDFDVDELSYMYI